METPFWHKSKTTLYTSLLLSLSMALAGCMGEDSKARSNSSDTIVVNKIADITNESKDNYDDNVNGLITHKTLKKWIDNWEANRPAGISGKLVIFQQAEGPAGAKFIKPNNKNVFTYVESGWLETRDDGVMNVPSMIVSGPSIDRLIRKYGIDVNKDMIVCAQGGSSAGNYMNQGRCWFTFSYWGVPQQQIALLNGNNTHLQTTSLAFTDVLVDGVNASPIINQQKSSVKDLKADNTVLYASVEDVINVLPYADAPNAGTGVMLWDARSIGEYSGYTAEWDAATENTTVLNTTSPAQLPNRGARQSHPRGALNLQYTNLMDMGTGIYHNKKTLWNIVRGQASPSHAEKQSFVSGGIDGDYQPVQFGNAYQEGDVIYHYCETSMRAGVTIIAAGVILGIPSRLYDAAMVEWNSLTSGTVDHNGVALLPAGSIWDTELLSAPQGVYSAGTINPRSAEGWAQEIGGTTTADDVLEGLLKSPLI